MLCIDVIQVHPNVSRWLLEADLKTIAIGLIEHTRGCRG
jgi:hypothetical protein